MLPEFVASVVALPPLVADVPSLPVAGHAPGCQCEEASQAWRSRASGTSARVASKSAW